MKLSEIPERLLLGPGPSPVSRDVLDAHDIESGGGLGSVADEIVRIGLMGSGCSRDNVKHLLDAVDAF